MNIAKIVEKFNSRITCTRKISSTNKTIFRWETGVYIRPIEMLLELSKLLQASIPFNRINVADYHP